MSLRLAAADRQAARGGARRRARRAARRRRRSSPRARPPSCCSTCRSRPRRARRRAPRRRGAERWCAHHPFPTCFVCGPDRAAATGCGIFPGALDGGPLRGRLDSGRLARRRRRPRAAGVRLGRARLPHQRAGGQLRRAGPPIVLGAADRAARLPGAGRASRTRSCPGRSDRRAQAAHAACALFDSTGGCMCASQRALDRAEGSSLRAMATPLPHLSVLRGHLRPRGRRSRDGDVTSVRGDERGRVQPRLHLPEGASGSSSCTRTPTASAPRWSRRDGELCEATWDEAFAEIDRRLTPILDEHGRNAVAVYLGNPNAHNLSALTLRPRAAAGARHAEHLLAPARSTRCPSRCPPGLMFGAMLQRARSRTSTAPTTC